MTLFQSKDYTGYAKDAKGKHSIMLPLTLHSYLETRLDPLFRGVDLPSSLSKAVILGGHNDTAEMLALNEYVRRMSNGKVDYQGHVVSFSQKANQTQRHPKLHNGVLHSFGTFFLTVEKREVICDDVVPTVEGLSPCASDFDIRSDNITRDNSEASSSSKQEQSPTRSMETPESILKQSQIFIFGNLFCQYVRKQTQNSQQSASLSVMSMLKFLFACAPDDAVFIFMDLPDTAKHNVVYQNLQHILQRSNVLLSEPEKFSGVLGLPGSDHTMIFTIAVKTPSYKLHPSFYSTLSYLRSFTSSPLVKTDLPEGLPIQLVPMFSSEHHDLLNFRSLTRSVKFSEDYLKFDIANSRRLMSTITLLNKSFEVKWLNAFDLSEKALKRKILLEWFSRIRNITERYISRMS
ncbi:hypothetical protein MP638_003423 [Amoeboaphelidium occidentale]|nr:hypothetical protein MP638_003423 [Amoeboaphelidium occidentale]